ncbi:MAG: hypothetical protein ACK4JD_10875 [Thermoflexales bacterium]
MEADDLIRLFVAALTAHYWTFVLQRKEGPLGCFARLRAWMRARLPSLLARHLLCPTCAALSVGLLSYALTYVAPALALALAVPGATMLVGGMSGHPHFPDPPDDEEA